MSYLGRFHLARQHDLAQKKYLSIVVSEKKVPLHETMQNANRISRGEPGHIQVIVFVNEAIFDLDRMVHSEITSVAFFLTVDDELMV